MSALPAMPRLSVRACGHGHLHLCGERLRADFSPRRFRLFAAACAKVIEARVLGPLWVTFLLSPRPCPQEDDMPDILKPAGVRVGWSKDAGCYVVEFLDGNNRPFAQAPFDEPAWRRLIADAQAVLESVRGGGLALVACEGRA